tara:strand:- start:759 stop:2063 length:1305 start_codon:yes stop_codon:yes gene_type:complete
MNSFKKLRKKIINKKAIIGIIGLGYVGLPLLLAYSLKNFKVIGFDIDKKKINKLNTGKSYLTSITDFSLKKAKKNFTATNDFKFIKKCDVIVICVPTPLKKNFLPDLSYLKKTIKKIYNHLNESKLICLESTSYPGTTKEEIIDKLNSKFNIGLNIFVGYSPEREDPGNKKYKNTDVPKIISGHSKNCSRLTKLFYEAIFKKTIEVSSTSTAEFTKLLENIYRSINIGLVNEMKIIARLMKIDIHEVIRAASSKPFGFTPFYPGPGMGGHCIPIDPFYMAWKSKKLGYDPVFIKSSGTINQNMPVWTITQIVNELRKKKIEINRSKLLIVGVSYKKNVNDTRESPALEIISLLKKKKAKIDYHDPHINELYKTRKFNFKYKSIKLSKKIIKEYDAVIVVTDHDKINYALLENNSKIIFDCRNIINQQLENVIKI